MKKFLKYLLIAIAIIGLCAYTRHISTPNITTVTLINNSSKTIKDAVISVDNSILTTKNMAIKSQVTATLPFKGETHYNLSVSFYDNSTFSQEIGYLMSPIDMMDVILITDNGTHFLDPSLTN